MNQSENIKQTYNNSDYINTSALSIRLVPDDLLKEIRIFLSGKEIVYAQKENGSIEAIESKTGNALINNIGLQSIMSFLRLNMNPQVVQGNYTEQMYYQHIGSVRDDLADSIIINRNNWEIKEEHTDMIINYIMDCIKPYVSRTIDNGERNSYQNTLVSRENQKVDENNKRTWF